VLALCHAGAGAAPARSPACHAIADCIDAGALCVLVQVPRREQATLAASEAFGDMETQVGQLLARRSDVRYAVVTQDLSRLLAGLQAGAALRTVFLSRGGLALLNRGLYVDDPAPVEAYFATRIMPPSLQGILQPLTLARRPGACAAGKP
jgi:hypothetical protein